MKKYILLLIIISSGAFGRAYSQDTLYHSIQEVLDHHLEQFKAKVSRFDNVFIQTKLDDTVNLPPKVLRIQNDIDAKYLKGNDKNFLIEVRIATQVNYIKMDITNYRVVKLSNKKIKLINLSNGATYFIGTH